MSVQDFQQLTRDGLQTLLRERHAHCVSLFLGLAQIGQETPADSIRLKNLAHDAMDDLIARGMRKPDAEALLAPATEIAAESLKWQTGGSGIALFLSEDGGRRYRLPRSFDDLVIVNDRFHIESLLPLMSADGRFYVLTLSRKRVRTYEATRHSITEIAVPNMPKSIEDVIAGEEWETGVRQYTNSPAAGAGGGTAMHYGQGSTTDFVKKEILAFFRAVDAALFESLKLEHAPLVLACVAEEVPLYREVNRYPHLVEQAVAIGPQLLPEDEIHHRAWAIVRPLFEKAQTDAIERFNTYDGTGHASAKLDEIVPAAVFGRIESLLVRSGTHVWGAFDPETGAVEPHPERLPGDEDLVDMAASYALASRGDVYSLPPELMPADAVAAAVFRYQVNETAR